MIWIKSEDKVHMPLIGPSVFGRDNWGKVKSKDNVLEGKPIGAGPLFEDTYIYQSFRAVFVDGKDWAQTEFFKRAVGRINRGIPRWNCTSEAELLRRLNEDIGLLYDSMKEHGFLSQQAIRRAMEDGTGRKAMVLQRLAARTRPRHNIKIGINEAGQLLFLDGRHRFAIARLLGLERVAARVVFRHRTWSEVHAVLRAICGPNVADCQRYVPEHADLARYRLSATQRAAVVGWLQSSGLPVPNFTCSRDTSGRRHPP